MNIMRLSVISALVFAIAVPLADAADREDIEAEVNRCIAKALEGRPIGGRDMEDLLEYIKSLKGKSTEKALSPPGC